MEANDYRLERWLAIILSLLFFLPFVARADELLYPGLYTDEQVPYKDGDSYLAIGPATLVPVKIRVESANVEENDVHNLTNIEVVGFEDTWLVRGKNLHPGPIVRAMASEADLVIGKTKTAITLGTTKYELSYRCADARCALILACGGVVQELSTVPAHFEPGDEPEHRLLFAGDLDHDGRLDLIANHTDRAWDWYPTLWLSSAAKKGELVGKAAQLVGTVDVEC